MKEELITSIPIFASLPREEIHLLAETLPQHESAPGTLLIREGHPASRFFILLEGQVEIIKALGSKDERLLAVRKAGNFIGEMGLLSKEGLHTASVRARTPLKLLEMTREEFDALLHRQPTLAYEMVRTLSRRLNDSENLTIRDLRRKNLELTLAYQELEAAQAQIVEKERLERELEVARDIQSSLLPRQLPARPGYDFGALMEPMSAVGGDFFDFIPLGKKRLGLVVGDVSDHGVPAALFMAMTVTLLRAEARREASPEAVLRNVNRQLLETNETGMFVTVLYGVLDLGRREFSYMRAGHEMPVIFSEDGQALTPPRGYGQLMGILDDPALDGNQVSLPPGSTLVLHTDGINEARDPQGKLFSVARLQEAVGALRVGSAQEICDQILAQVSAFREGDAPQDDISMLAVKVSPAG